MTFHGLAFEVPCLFEVHLNPADHYCLSGSGNFIFIMPCLTWCTVEGWARQAQVFHNAVRLRACPLPPGSKVMRIRGYEENHF